MTSSKIVESLRRRVIKSFMDILVLTEIRKGSLSGYDVIRLMQGGLGVLVSSGTVYSLLYSLERDGLIEGVWKGRKRISALTEKGEQEIELITKANDEVQNFLKNISLINAANHQSPMST